MVSKSLRFIADVSGQSIEELEEVTKIYPFVLTPFIRKRIEDGKYSQQALKQFTPDIQELRDVDGFTTDPAGEGNKHPEPAILQAYKNRLVIMLTYQCLVYCRFCVRKAFVGMPEYVITDEQITSALAYVAKHTEIEDVILSGGDPLAVPNRRLLPFLQELVRIPHVKVIRIDSRAVSTMPQRIDDDLINFLKQYDHFWYHSHMNHPDDIDHPEVLEAIRRLRMAGIPVLNQSVILAGVNDDVQVMTRLMQLCYQNKVIPYNLYVMDRVKGGAHFEVSTERIIEICKALSDLPGPAQPVLISVDTQSRKHRAIYDETSDLQAFIEARGRTALPA